MQSYQPNLHELPADLQSRVREVVDADEQLVWVGRPVASRQWLSAYFTVVGGVIALSAFIWLSGAWHMLSEGSVIGPFFLAGMAVVMIILPAGVPLILARGKLYLLTTRRAIITGPKRFGIDLSRSYQPHQLHAIYCRRVFAGVGDVILERRSGSKRDAYYGFRAIRSPHEVQKMIEATLLSDTPYAVSDPTDSKARILCSPIATESASFRTTEIKRPSSHVLQVAPTLGARMFGLLMLPFGLALAGTAVGLYWTSRYQGIGRFHELPIGGVALLIFLCIFAIGITLLSLKMLFRSPITFDASTRSIRGGGWPKKWVQPWNEVCCVQGIVGEYESSSDRSYLPYELNLVFKDRLFSRQNLSCHADRQATVEMGAELAAFIDRPWLDWISDAENAEAAAEALRDRR